MSLLIGFLPFLAFAVLASYGQVLAGLLAATAIATGAMLRSRSLRWLEAGSVGLFAALALCALLAPVPPPASVVRLAVNGGLAAIVLLSLAVGRPFTLPYAREQAPREIWTHPVFLAVNRRITLVWALAFAVMALADALPIAAPSLAGLFPLVLQAMALAAALSFTVWYPKHVRRRATPAGRA